MVDSIKNQSAVSSGSQASIQSAKSTQKSVNNSAEQSKVVSSSGEEAARTEGAAASSKRMAALLRGLNDAVNYSSLALDSLKKVGAGETGTEKSPDVVQHLSDDVAKLSDDFNKVLEDLRGRMDMAEVMRENMAASNPSIDDVDKATQHVMRTRSNILQNEKQAMDAHQGLDPARVALLLQE